MCFVWCIRIILLTVFVKNATVMRIFCTSFRVRKIAYQLKIVGKYRNAMCEKTSLVWGEEVVYNLLRVIGVAIFSLPFFMSKVSRVCFPTN